MIADNAKSSGENVDAVPKQSVGATEQSASTLTTTISPSDLLDKCVITKGMKTDALNGEVAKVIEVDDNGKLCLHFKDSSVKPRKGKVSAEKVSGLITHHTMQRFFSSGFDARLLLLSSCFRFDLRRPAKRSLGEIL